MCRPCPSFHWGPQQTGGRSYNDRGHNLGRGRSIGGGRSVGRECSHRCLCMAAHPYLTRPSGYRILHRPISHNCGSFSSLGRLSSDQVNQSLPKVLLLHTKSIQICACSFFTKSSFTSDVTNLFLGKPTRGPVIFVITKTSKLSWHCQVNHH